MLGLRKQCLVRYTVSTFIKITNGAKDGKKIMFTWLLSFPPALVICNYSDKERK